MAAAGCNAASSPWLLLAVMQPATLGCGSSSKAAAAAARLWAANKKKKRKEKEEKELRK